MACEWWVTGMVLMVGVSGGRTGCEKEMDKYGGVLLLILLTEW